MISGTPANITVAATSATSVDTDSVATVGGSSGNNSGSQDEMNENGGSTSEGDVGVAGAITLNIVASTTQAEINTSSPISTAGRVQVYALDDTDAEASAVTTLLSGLVPVIVAVFSSTSPDL